MLEQVRSLKFRLIVYFMFAIITILALLTLSISWLSNYYIKKANETFLKDELHNITSILQDKKINEFPWKKWILQNTTNATHSLYPYDVEITKPDGSLLLNTSNFPSLQISSDISSGITVDTTISTLETDSVRNNRYLILTSSFKHPSFSKPLIIRLSLNLTLQQSLLHEKLILSTLLLAVLVLSLGLIVFMVRYGLSDLDPIIRDIRELSADSIHHKIDHTNWPKEFASLGIELNHLLTRIENNVTRAKEMSTDMSHELRTPITVLMNRIESLILHNSNKEDTDATLTLCLEDLQKISSIIDNLLFLARVDDPSTALHKTFISADKTIQTMIEFYQASLDEKNIHCTLTGSGQLHVNKVMFKRLISNLLSNAIKYTHSDGTIQINIKEQKDSLIITITDTGIGIPQDALPYIFDRFYRADIAHASKIPGTGLGLSIAKSITIQHHGDIQVASTLNKGTTVTLTLPR